MTRRRGKGRLEPVGSILDAVLEGTGLRRRAEERSVLERWVEVAGERLAAHVRAVDLADGVLVLDADHGAWRQEPTLLFPDILRHYNERCGADTVTEIRWLHRGRGGARRVDGAGQGAAGREAGGDAGTGRGTTT